MNRCKDCQHWVNSNAHRIAIDGHLIAKCEHAKVGSSAEDRYNDGAGDAEWYGGIYAAENFGCIHWEVK